MIKLLYNDIREIWKNIIAYLFVLYGIAIFINGNIALLTIIFIMIRLIMTSSYNNDKSNIIIWNMRFISNRNILVFEKYILFIIIFSISNILLIFLKYLIDNIFLAIAIEMNISLISLSFLVSTTLVSIYLTHYFIYGSIKAFSNFKRISLTMGIIYILAIRILPNYGIDINKGVNALLTFDLKIAIISIGISLFILAISIIISLYYFNRKDL